MATIIDEGDAEDEDGRSRMEDRRPLESILYSRFAILNLVHSYLSATIGSTLVARRAGMKLAIRATAPNSSDMPANVNGS